MTDKNDIFSNFNKGIAILNHYFTRFEDWW